MGVIGRETRAAWAKSNTWGTPATVTKQILMTSMEGMDSQPQMVYDESHNQSWVGAGEIGDHQPVIMDLAMQLRYEGIDSWIAAACGSPAAAAVVSSAGANSLVACRHVITMATKATHYLTLAADMSLYTQEIPSLKVRGFQIRTGDGGRMMITFPIVGAKVNYSSATNTNSALASAAAMSLGNRLFRKNSVFRMNVQSTGSLVAADQVVVGKDIQFSFGRVLAQDDFVHGQDYILDATDDNFPDTLGLEITYARMTSPTANSLVVALQAAQAFKADWTFTGPYINSTTTRSFLIQMPALQLTGVRIAPAGPGEVRPVGMFRMSRAEAAPTGMAGITDPFQITIVNGNSVTLLS